MARRKTYVYHLLIGHEDRIEVDCYMFARNAGVAIDYCKELYRDKKYNSYRAIKVGLARELKDTQIIDEYEADKIRRAGGDQEKYSEREIEEPRFVTKEEAGELGL